MAVKNNIVSQTITKEIHLKKKGTEILTRWLITVLFFFVIFFNILFIELG